MSEGQQYYDWEHEEAGVNERDEVELTLFLEGLYLLHGFDFRHYVRSSIRRRITNRMRLEKLPTMTALLDRVLHNDEMLDKVLSDFSIKVTEMFRDPSFFRAFRDQVIPRLANYPEIRIWHAGCATGEEVYSMSILMQEAGLSHKTKLYATDMNESAIESARRGAFPLKQMQLFTKNYLEAGGAKEFSEYYSADHQYAFFHPSLKENIMFAQHNLVTDGSFNEFHVILCRNVLIYFDTTLQHQVHQLFYNSLALGGILGLGSKESIVLLNDSISYEEIVHGEPIYRKMR
ncbi:CheR family methyltransferase [Paenibacillus sp. GCM10023252]|uniref:CheR family methyltransferase n=1 Tax=Paenibacillus sp. GCM10023252 TaxID=3252649 RepID=UPI00360F2621